MEISERDVLDYVDAMSAELGAMTGHPVLDTTSVENLIDMELELNRLRTGEAFIGDGFGARPKREGFV